MKLMRRFPIAISLLCSFILLQLCPLACFATGADQEIEAEAQKLLPTYFTKCGDDYFSKQTFQGNPDTYIIGQYKELTTRVVSQPLSKADVICRSGVHSSSCHAALLNSSFGNALYHYSCSMR